MNDIKKPDNNLLCKVLRSGDLLKVKIKSVLIFGSQNYYGKDKRLAPLESPILIHDYPEDGLITSLSLGSFPDDVFKASRLERAYAQATVLGMAGEVKRMTDELITSLYEKPISSIPITKWNWFVSVGIEKEIEIEQEYLVSGRKYLWLHPSKTADLIKHYSQAWKNNIEIATSCALSIIDVEMFQDKIMESTICCSDGYHPITYVEPTLTGSVSMGHPIEALNISSISQRMQILKDIKDNSIAQLESSRYWYLMSLVEKDRWKQFQWGFLSLEILINKLSKSFYNQIINNIDKFPTNGAQLLNIEAISQELIPAWERLTLNAKFVIVSLALNPEKVDSDMSTFKLLKKSRDQLSHGGIKKAEELPNHQIISMLGRYFNKSFEYFIKSKNNA